MRKMLNIFRYLQNELPRDGPDPKIKLWGTRLTVLKVKRRTWPKNKSWRTGLADFKVEGPTWPLVESWGIRMPILTFWKVGSYSLHSKNVLKVKSFKVWSIFMIKYQYLLYQIYIIVFLVKYIFTLNFLVS